MIRAILFCFGVLFATVALGQPISGQKVTTAKIEQADLAVLFRDNAESPRLLSGIQSLFNLKSAADFDAYDPDDAGASAGMNFEHIIAGHRDPANRFTPRHGRYELYRLPDGKSVTLVRKPEDSPWKVSSTLKYIVNEPHYIDIEFRCVAREERRFGERGYAIFFFANYMNDVAEIPLHFRGITEAGGEERWVAGEAPETHPDWRRGGTYRHAEAADLAYDEDHNFKLNVWSYEYPRYTEPFYFGRAANNMVFILMFDKAYSPEDEIRFSLFKFKALREVDPQLRPAWDFQYVIHRVEEGKPYGFRARLVWKKFISADNCFAEYRFWQENLGRNQ